MPENELSSEHAQAAMQQAEKNALQNFMKLDGPKKIQAGIELNNIRAELRNTEKGRGDTADTKPFAGIKFGNEAQIVQLSPNEIQRLNEMSEAEDKKRIAEIRQAIGQAGEEETSDVSPWNPEGGARGTVRAEARQPELPSDRGQLISNEYLKQVDAASELEPETRRAIGQSEIGEEKGQRFGGTAAQN